MVNEYLQSYLSSNLRELQLKEVSILEEIDKICRKHNIDYWLDGGTCLGAIRHNGFIPWDDDIDIAIDEKDMARFVNIAKEELPEYLAVQDKTEYRKLGFVKIRDLNSYFVEAGDDFSKDYNKGIFVDIFPFRQYPTINSQVLKKIVKNANKSLAILRSRHYYSIRSFAEFFYFGIKYLFNITIFKLACIATNMNKNYANTVESNGYGTIHRREDVFPVKNIQFEGRTFLGPANPDQYLKSLYGDYMQLPPQDKRKVHSIFFMVNLKNTNKLSQ